MLGEAGFRQAMREMLHERGRVAEAMAEAGGFDALLKRTRTTLALEPDETVDIVLRRAAAGAPRPELIKAAEALMEGPATDRAFGESITAWLGQTEDERAESFDAYSELFFTAKGEYYAVYARKKSLAHWPEAEQVLRREATRLKSIGERLEAARAAALTEALLTAGGDLIRRYERRKAAEAALDYDDLVLRTATLLKRPGIAPWVLYKLDNGLDHILVDEAQDTSRAQWDIVRLLADEFFSGSGTHEANRTLFAVGDEKQSIFSFQHADPAAFAAMRGYFAQRIVESGKPYRELPLHVSFRSAPAILKAVDTIFAAERASAGVASEPVSHQAFHRDSIGRVEVWPLLPAAAKDAKDEAWPLPVGYEDERDPQAELAARIADTIAGWRVRKERLPGAARPIAPGDIMILLRKRGRFADLMVRALKKRGVPVTGVDRMRLIQQLPVMDLLALLRFALLPEDDLNLACVLRGPLIGISEDHLMTLAVKRKGTLWESLKLRAGDKAFAPAHDYLAGWLAKADFTTPFAMLTQILNTGCPGSEVSGRRAIWARLGPDALDPIEELLSAAQNFGRRHAPSIEAFLHWLAAGDSEIKREPDRGEADATGGQVAIMTVHAAKGLEAPIVFLPDAGTVPRTKDVPAFLWSGGAPLYVPRKPEAGVLRRAWDNARRLQLEEYRRLFYVALTRAARRLYIGGWEPTRREADQDQCWYNLAAEALRPLHEPASVEKSTEPLIAFSDPVTGAKEKKVAKEAVAPTATPLPVWAFAPAPQEPAVLKSLAPSRLLPPATATPDGAFARGRIIHRLLQSLPDLPAAQRAAAAARFLANPQHNLSKTQQEEIAREVLRLFDDPLYAPLFGPDSRAEVPLAGVINGRKIGGQLDRLCIREDGIWVVDYKTNRPPPARVEDVAEAYRLQLKEYREVLRAIYPGRPVRCFLLWTYAPSLMELPEAFLAS